jgi:excisionase family DNA binding protein
VTTDVLLSTKQAAARLGVSQWTLLRLVEAGEIKRIKVRSASRYSAAGLDAFILRNTERVPARAGG